MAAAERAPVPGPDEVPQRLQKFLARAGVASRRGSEDLMTAGRVRVNGEVVTELGAKVVPLRDEVTVDGKPVTLATGPVYYALNKPKGYVTTMADTHGRPTVADLLPKGAPAGLFPVGRLDQDTTGLLLLTTDGELGHRLTHPRYHVPKTYIAQVRGEMTESEAVRLRRGVELDDGPTKPAQVRVQSATPRVSRVEVVLTEGRKRQVRRMLDLVGHRVTALKRVSFGPVQLHDLALGETRPLTPNEVATLKRMAGLPESDT